MFYEVPSWLYYLNLSDILVLVAYILLFALIESILLLGFVILLSICLPNRVFKNKFIAQGSMVVGTVCVAAVSVQRRLGLLNELKSWQIIVFPLVFVFFVFIVAAFFAKLLDHYTKLQSLLQGLVDRVTVFTYFYVPLSVLSLFVVIFRNVA